MQGSTVKTADVPDVNTPDSNGYHLLQWAALNNRVPETTYLLKHGANVNAADSTGQTALHWAAVNGSLNVMEMLLRHGAEHSARDNRGYTVAHIAAQYGQTTTIYHLFVRWNVNVDSPDNDGRTPLHWAAYKGFADTIRLLLVLEARYSLADKESCTPLHWAAIKGSGEACMVLLQGGSFSLINEKDATGSTAGQLATSKGNHSLGQYISEFKIKHGVAGGKGGWLGKHERFAWLTSWTSTDLCPLIWLYVIGLVTLFSYTSMTSLVFWGRSVVVSAAAALVLLYRATTSNPGLIPRGVQMNDNRDKCLELTWMSDAEHGQGGLPGASTAVQRSSVISGSAPVRASSSAAEHKAGLAKLLDSQALWAGNWQQLCVTCHIVRPLRAKHCSETNRCIEVYDHYCPWVGNAIGKGNRHLFLVFLWVALYSITTAAIVGVVQIYNQRAHLHPVDVAWIIGFEVFDMFLGIPVAMLAYSQALQIARNVTTNEHLNWRRYKYMHTHDGESYITPFSKGCLQNCKEAFQAHAAPSAPTFLPAKECCSILNTKAARHAKCSSVKRGLFADA